MKAYFPELDETLADAQYITGSSSPRDAAEKAASERCISDVEWGDHKVTILFKDKEYQFYVLFRTEPIFSATEIN